MNLEGDGHGPFQDTNCIIISLKRLWEPQNLTAHSWSSNWDSNLGPLIVWSITLRRPRSRDNSVVQPWAAGWTIGVLGFGSRRGLEIFLFTRASRTALGPTQPPIQWVPGALSLGVKWPGREADHSPPSSAEVKEWVELSSTPPIRPHGVVLG
jgi:hypothetical protein